MTTSKGRNFPPRAFFRPELRGAGRTHEHFAASPVFYSAGIVPKCLLPHSQRQQRPLVSETIMKLCPLQSPSQVVVGHRDVVVPDKVFVLIVIPSKAYKSREELPNVVAARVEERMKIAQ